MNHLRAFLLIMLTILAGCSTTGGTIGGLVPAPKFLKGEIKNSIYIAQDKSFSVAVPQGEGSYEYSYMQVKEQYSEYGAYISFGPAALDQSVYRLETAKRITPESRSVKFDDFAPHIVENYKTQLQSGFGTMPQVVVSRPDTVNGRKAYYWKLTQTIPEGKYISDRDATFIHEVYVVDFDKGVAIVWVQVTETIKASMEAHAFAESVVMN